jgi:hypothetical protein
VSHPIPLHPDADLALVLDEMRQSVAAWGDEGLVMRVFKAGICLALLSILDALIDLLADFRAGRLPPVLPAEDELACAVARRVGFQPTIATKSESADAPSTPPSPADPAVTFPRDPISRKIRAPETNDRRAAPSGDPEQSAALAPRRPGLVLVSAAFAIPRAGKWPRVFTFHPSHVPRPPADGLGFWGARPTHVFFVTI